MTQAPVTAQAAPRTQHRSFILPTTPGQRIGRAVHREQGWPGGFDLAASEFGRPVAVWLGDGGSMGRKEEPVVLPWLETCRSAIDSTLEGKGE